MNWLSTMNTQVELRRLGEARLLDVPVDVDAGVARDLGIEPEVVVPRPAGAGEDHAELDLTVGHGCSLPSWGFGFGAIGRGGAGQVGVVGELGAQRGAARAVDAAMVERRRRADQQPGVRVLGSRMTSRVGPCSTISPAVQHHDAVGDAGDRSEVVGDEQLGDAVDDADRAAAARGSGCGWPRRARSPARRGRSGADRGRGRGRWRRAAAARPTARRAAGPAARSRGRRAR